MKPMMQSKELFENLSQFYGTEAYYYWSILFPKCVLTDGVKYLADNAECYWMIDTIASHIPSASHKDERCKDIQFWKFKKGTPGNPHKLTCEADTDQVVITKDFYSTDFPLDEITIYVQWNGKYWVFMLPSEY